MNPDPIADLRDLLWRRELTLDERRRVAVYLAQHPEAVPDWQADFALARAARRLSPVPVSSNFTARVLAEVQREAAAHRPVQLPWWQPWLGARWVPAVGAAMVSATVVLATWQIEAAKRQADYAHQVSALRALAVLPPAVLEDFEAIRRYGESAPSVDFGLLAALE